MDRKQYWNEEYLRYWKERTSDSDGRVLPSDCIPADVSLFETYLPPLKLNRGDKVLEIGVGFGRLIPSLLKQGALVYGVDISAPMITEAKRRWGAQVVDLREADAERLPYQETFFDAVICWAVFDACFQGPALSEIARVLRVGGRLLLTGKNNNYCDDDEPAYVAEVNARAKGHPNYFTNFAALRSALPRLGLTPERVFYFERRGDFSANRYTVDQPERFYEYALTAVKSVHTGRRCNSKLSGKFSVTFHRRAATPPVSGDM